MSSTSVQINELLHIFYCMKICGLFVRYFKDTQEHHTCEVYCVEKGSWVNIKNERRVVGKLNE